MTGHDFQQLPDQTFQLPEVIELPVAKFLGWTSNRPSPIEHLIISKICAGYKQLPPHNVVEEGRVVKYRAFNPNGQGNG